MIIQFKEWLNFIEAIDPNDEPALQNFITQNHPDKSQEINTFLQQFRDNPNTIPKATIFRSLNQQFPIQRNIEAIDPKVEQIYQSVNIPTNTVTKPEIVVITKFKDENPELLKELATKLRNYIQNKIISLTLNNNLITISYFPKDEQNQRTKTAKVYQPDNLTKTIAYIHMIDSMEDDTEVLEKDLADPRELAVQYKDELVAVSNNKKIYVFKAKDPLQCRRMGQGQNWCIASSNSVAHYFDYRFEHGQTQYFIFDFNKAPNDPARYVNPGVAPNGEYSEWVDRRNEHEEDPNDSNSAVGINGYDSIENYLKYLESQGIDRNVFVAEPVSEDERKFESWNGSTEWFQNLNEKDQKFYMQIHPLTSSQFNTLSEKDKLFYIKNNHHKDVIDGLFDGKYLELSNEKIDYNEMIVWIIKNKKELSANDVWRLLAEADNKQKIAKLIMKFKKQLSDDDVYYLLDSATDKKEIANALGPENINKLTDNNVYDLLKNTTDTQEMANILGSENINKLTDNNVKDLLQTATDSQEMANILGSENINKLTDNNVFDLIRWSNDAKKMMKLLGSENMNKLSKFNVSDLIRNAKNKQKMEQLIRIYKMPEDSRRDGPLVPTPEIYPDIKGLPRNQKLYEI